LLAVAASVVFFLSGFSWLPPFQPGFAAAVQALQAEPGVNHAALLIASNPVFADAEAAFIAEWAARRRGGGSYLLRATQLLSYPASTGPDRVEFL
jgi:hypothetical protein